MKKTIILAIIVSIIIWFPGCSSNKSQSPSVSGAVTDPQQTTEVSNHEGSVPPTSSLDSIPDAPTTEGIKAKDTVVVPDLTMLSSEQAVSELYRLGLTYVLSYDFGGETPESEGYIPPDCVITQSLGAGQRVKPGTEITLVISTGPESAAIPDNPDE